MTKGSVIEREYKRAASEGRQPRCPFCGDPLEVAQTQLQYLVWRWDQDKKRYCQLAPNGDAGKPYCLACETADWEFVDGDLVDC